jgi:hypothetical protein
MLISVKFQGEKDLQEGLISSPSEGNYLVYHLLFFFFFFN